jgi:hypothetical protein
MKHAGISLKAQRAEMQRIEGSICIANDAPRKRRKCADCDGGPMDYTEISLEAQKAGMQQIDQDSNMFPQIRSEGSGLLTCRWRPYAIPQPRFALPCHRRQIDPNHPYPSFHGLPNWLKPFLYAQWQHGHHKDRLSSIFSDLPSDLVFAIQIACLAVVSSTLRRIQCIAREDVIPCQSTTRLAEDEPWWFEGIGLSDEELETFHDADFGVQRYDA